MRTLRNGTNVCKARFGKAFKLLCCSFVLMVSEFKSDAFEVRGIINYESYSLGITNLSSTKEFQVEVNGCDWLIKTFAMGECIRTEKAFHEGNLLNLTVHCAQSTGRGSNVYVGLIEADEIPNDDGSQINYLWLAYASACYFIGNPGNELRPVCCLDDESLRTERFKMKSFFSLTEAAEKLPVFVSYLSDGYYRTRTDKGRLVFPAPAPFDQGYTNAVYAARDFTNCGDVQIPLHFEFTRFAVPHDGVVRTQLTVRTRIVGQATFVALQNSSTVLLPEFPGEFVVKDNRFLSPNTPLGQLRYRIRDGKWLDETNVMAAKAAEAKQQLLQKRGLARAAVTAHIEWFRVVWAAVFLGSLGIVLWAWFKSRKTTN